MDRLELARWYYESAISHARDKTDSWEYSLDLEGDRFSARMIRKFKGKEREVTCSTDIQEGKDVAIPILDMARDMLNIMFPRHERKPFDLKKHQQYSREWRAKKRAVAEFLGLK